MEVMEDRFFWRQMYEAAVERREEERKMSDWYKRRAREAERAKKHWKNAVIYTGLAVCCAACVASWAMLIGG